MCQGRKGDRVAVLIPYFSKFKSYWPMISRTLGPCLFPGSWPSQEKGEGQQWHLKSSLVTGMQKNLRGFWAAVNGVTLQAICSSNYFKEGRRAVEWRKRPMWDDEGCREQVRSPPGIITGQGWKDKGEASWRAFFPFQMKGPRFTKAMPFKVSEK